LPALPEKTAGGARASNRHTVAAEFCSRTEKFWIVFYMIYFLC